MLAADRITSILNAVALDRSVTGVDAFSLSAVTLPADYSIELPTNLRLGHLAERIVGGLLKASTNYEVRYESLQVRDGNRTLGELDFLLVDLDRSIPLHLEVAYKFYLYDPTLLDSPLAAWIGPNRNDSLAQKLDKLRTKQFPLLNHPLTAPMIPDLDIAQVKPVLCLMASLFIPYELAPLLAPRLQAAVRGYYLDYLTFVELDTTAKRYHLPPKIAWGIEPTEQYTWQRIDQVASLIEASLREQQAVLCWECEADQYRQYFVVWW